MASQALSVKPNRRRYPRRNFHRKVSVLLRGQYRICLCTQIGEGGMGFYYPESIEERQQLVVTFKIPGGSYVAVKVIVENCVRKGNDYIVGVEFMNLEFSERRSIRSFVASRTEG